MHRRWASGTHLGHQLYIEVENNGRGGPLWILRRRQAGSGEAMVISGRSAQRLVAEYLRQQTACELDEALGSASRALNSEAQRLGLHPPR